MKVCYQSTERCTGKCDRLRVDHTIVIHELLCQQHLSGKENVHDITEIKYVNLKADVKVQ